MSENIKKKILIVDDNEDALLLAYVQLTKVGGFEAETASNAGQVITILEEKCKANETCFNLILIDIDLPDVRGTTLAKWIREKYPKVAIILYTAYGRLPHFVDAAEAIGADLITKPTLLEDLIAAINKAIIEQPKKAVSLNVPRIMLKHILTVAKGVLN